MPVMLACHLLLGETRPGLCHQMPGPQKGLQRAKDVLYLDEDWWIERERGTVTEMGTVRYFWRFLGRDVQIMKHYYTEDAYVLRGSWSSSFHAEGVQRFRTGEQF